MLGSQCIDVGDPASDPDPDGSRQDMGALPTYKTAPQISLTSPPPLAQGVPQGTSVSATFDMPLDPATINGDNFLVSSQGGGRSGTISYDHLTRTATFTPDAPFDLGETVQAQLMKGIANLWGVAMEADYNWSFQISTTTDVVISDLAGVPEIFLLQQNYPNPFNSQTQIQFSIPEPEHVGLKVFNMLGQVVNTLVDADLAAGNHQAAWNGTDHKGQALASGVYFCRLEAGDKRDMHKMILMR